MNKEILIEKILRTRKSKKRKRKEKKQRPPLIIHLKGVSS